MPRHRTFDLENQKQGMVGKGLMHTMVATLHHNDVIPFCGGPRDFDGRFDGFAPRIPKEEAVERLVRHHMQERLD